MQPAFVRLSGCVNACVYAEYQVIKLQSREQRAIFSATKMRATLESCIYNELEIAGNSSFSQVIENG